LIIKDKINRERFTPLPSIKSFSSKIHIEESHNFVANEERQLKKILYPHDPSLNPQFVWDNMNGHGLVNLFDIMIVECGEAQKDKASAIASACDFGFPPSKLMAGFPTGLFGGLIIHRTRKIQSRRTFYERTRICGNPRYVRCER
jgi:hypothetical protein